MQKEKRGKRGKGKVRGKMSCSPPPTPWIGVFVEMKSRKSGWHLQRHFTKLFKTSVVTFFSGKPWLVDFFSCMLLFISGGISRSYIGIFFTRLDSFPGEKREKNKIFLFSPPPLSQISSKFICHGSVLGKENETFLKKKVFRMWEVHISERNIIFYSR